MTIANSEESPLLLAVLSKVNGEEKRLNTVISALIRHLHAFVAETRPSEGEWTKGLEFLVATGAMCSARRNEFILLSDMLGLTTAVDDVNNDGPAGMTPSSVEGPFHSTAPERKLGDWISFGPERHRGTPTVVHGCVGDTAGNAVSGAEIDLWQANDSGLYDSQDATQDDGNLRALLKSDANGEYWFRTIRPSSYPVPTDGPAGELLRAIGRHPMRPAHIHLRVSAPGYRRLTTHVFLSDDQYLDSDAAFAVKPELICSPARHAAGPATERWLMEGPFEEIEFDIHLVPIDWKPEQVPPDTPVLTEQAGAAR